MDSHLLRLDTPRSDHLARHRLHLELLGLGNGHLEVDSLNLFCAIGREPGKDLHDPGLSG